MITRTFDAASLNEVANRPDIRPAIGPGDDPVDLTPLVADPNNIVLSAPGGGFVLVRQDPGVYELHTVFGKEGRGKTFFAAARAMFRYAFAKTDALELLTKCPDDNPGARMAAATVGFRERFRREDAWTKGVGISYRVFDVDDWTARDPEALKAGREFHAALEAAKVQRSSEADIHPEDEAHDRAVGAALLMAWGGNIGKGVLFYNRWARFAGYQPIGYMGGSLVDIQDAIVELQEGRTEILLLR